MMTVSEFSKTHNISYLPLTSNEENWLEEHSIDAPYLGEDGSLSEMEYDYLDNWENFSDSLIPDKMYAICFDNEGCEFIYEFNNDEVDKGMEMAIRSCIRSCEDDKELLDRLYLYNGAELIVYCQDEIEYIKDMIEDERSIRETYDSLRRLWQDIKNDYFIL